MGDHVAVPTSTQAKHPWRATVRTAFAGVVAFAGMYGLIVQTLGLDPNIEWVGGSLAVATGITRVMALPAVDAFIRAYLPFLAPDSNGK